ncbi:DUF5013 domain-containing protein [Flavobacterium sp. CF136]|uniref:DUF5013 domain-containing protein n=1 Tax=Flavobacterium sp. (strain CF136) TaxID=1144313 RepID=UPI000271B8FB|nr:DUF5013 domain-containing protein [Flavobacterium sp. CF136]EJL64424.1 IPT/TIG domain-containing protein [Flavobacterium sp. CF136]
MKLLYKLSISFMLFAICLIAFSSCEEDANFKIYEYPEQTVTGMSTQAGYPGINVTITGKDFGVLKNAVKIYFGTILANVVSCEDTKIVVQVPTNAVSADVTLKIWTHDSGTIGSFTVLPAPAITSVVSANALNPVALPEVDIVTINGVNFGTDASKVAVSFSGTPATIQTIADNKITVMAPANYATGFISITMGGLTISSTSPIVNPNAAGDLTPYFLKNTGPGFTQSSVSGRWGTLAAPWITNAAGKNKSGTYGGYTADKADNVVGNICWETYGNTPIIDGIIYQPTSMPLSVGSYTITFKVYSEIQTNSSVYCVVAAGGTGIPVLANLSTAIASVALPNPAVVGTSQPRATETKTLTFNITSPQVVSIGFLGNLTANNYFWVSYIKLVKN